MNEILMWLGTTWLHTFMVENTSAFIIAETLHFIGLTLLIGALMVIDLRGLGLFKRMSLIELHKLVPVAILGFAINLATGVAFLAYDPANYLGNAAFLAKMALICLAFFNALLFEFAVFRPLAAGALAVERGAVVKFSSGLSLAIWAGVLILGRLIPYA